MVPVITQRLGRRVRLQLRAVAVALQVVRERHLLLRGRLQRQAQRVAVPRIAPVERAVEIGRVHRGALRLVEVVARRGAR